MQRADCSCLWESEGIPQQDGSCLFNNYHPATKNPPRGLAEL